MDWDGPVSLENDVDSVRVNEEPCPLTNDQVDDLATLVTPLQASQNHGIDLYQQALQYVTVMTVGV